MKLIRTLILSFMSLLLILSFSACDNINQEVEIFNTQTEETISLYEATLEVAKDKEQELVMGIFTGDIALPCKPDLDYKDAHDLLVSNTNSLIEELVLVNSTHFYTRLGVNSVTQVTDFHFQGTRYILQVLWVDCKIDMIVLEVQNNVG